MRLEQQEEKEGLKESQVTVTETETRAACYSAFRKLCKRSRCLFVYVGVAEYKCVSAHVCARYVCKPGDVPQLKFTLFICQWVLRQDLSLAWSSLNGLGCEHVFLIWVLRI